MTTGVGAMMAGGFGLILGSFLNVVAYRLPRGESLASPASRCPGCETPIKPYDNVPVLSWLLLRGRCRSCGTSIAWRYPLVELATALLMALAVIVIGPNEQVWLGLAFVLLLCRWPSSTSTSGSSPTS
jgi:leader peptidase (prepilin peptidase)/N-methyltransferase